MSEGGSNKKLLIAGAAAVAVVGGAAAWYFLSKSSDDSVDEFKPRAVRKEPTTEAPKPSATTKTADVAGSQSTGIQRSDTLVCNEYGFDGSANNLDDADASASAAPAAIRPTGQPDENGVVHFPHLGCVLQLQQGWNVQEDMAPMPNVMVIGLSKTEWSSNQEGAPGSTPIVLLSIEDISSENLSLTEFKEKSKNMAISQMMMMTNGMIRPTISFDGPLHVGAFTHCLEYEQATPMFKIQVLNLIATRGGLAYVFQLMCNPDEFAKVRSEVMAIAKTVELDSSEKEVPFDENSYIQIKAAGGSLRIPSSWSLTTARAHKANTALFDLKNGSTQKTEIITVYKAGDADNAMKSWVPVSSSTVSGATVKKLKEGGRNERKVVEANGVVVIANPLMTSTIATSDEQLITIAKSFDESNASESTHLSFATPRLGYGHSIEAGGRVIDSRVSERTIVYAPLGLSQEQDNPIMTVRVGDPTNDPDCRPSLDEWEQRIKSEIQPGISKIKQETINGQKVVTFENREMVETGPSTKEERLAKVIIFLKRTPGGQPRTTMFRWEAPSGNWRRHENLLTKVLNSVDLH